MGASGLRSLTTRLRSVLLAARTALSEDSARGADSARRAAADSVRRLEASYFSGKSLSGQQDVFPAAAAAGASVRASATPPLLAFLRPEQLPADLAQYLDVDAQGAPGGAANTGA